MVGSFAAMLAGGILVIKSADLLVRGGSRLAASFGVPALLVGLTIVAYGTSAPEALVSVVSVAKGAGALAVGNVLGSNVANLALILGSAALARPLALDARLGRVDGPLLIGATVVLALFSADGRLSRPEGLLLLVGAIAYTVGCIRSARATIATPDEIDCEPISRSLEAVCLVGGLVGLALGASLLVQSAVTIARSLGLSELLIGATIIAVGTSLPELAASVTAARRGDHGLSVGNVVGSNLFNLLLVMGLAAVAGEVPVPRTALGWDLLPGLALAVGLVVAARTGRLVRRRHGALLVAAYAAYLAVCVWRQAAGIG